MPAAQHHVVIVGGGFGGLYAARALARAPTRVTLVDRRNFHLFQPLLYQVATGGLSPADISAPLRSILKRQPNARVLQAEVVDIDPETRSVILSEGRLSYDSLIVSTGVRHHYFGNEQWARWAPGLKTVEDATEIRARALSAFEAAERCNDADERRSRLTFVIVGAGPTGVELAGALGEMKRHTLRGEFRTFDPADARILLVDGANRVLPGYPDSLSRAARRSLEKLGVELCVEHLVSDVDDRSVTLLHGDATIRVATSTVVWAAGVQASPLATVIQNRAGAELDRVGRVRVAADCSLPEHPEILVIGDMCLLEDSRGEPLPGVAPVAMQQGRYVGRLIRARLEEKTLPAFAYRNRGNLAVIGRAAAVADLGRMKFSGYPAWLLWLFIHIMYLVEFENRLLVFVQWAFSYFTRKRGARLITGENE